MSDEPTDDTTDARFEKATLRDGETRDTSGHARRNLAALRQAQAELGRGHALDETRSRGERIRARRRVNAVAPCGPQANLTGFDVFGEIRSEVAGSVLLAAGPDLRDLGSGDEPNAETDGGVCV